MRRYWYLIPAVVMLFVLAWNAPLSTTTEVIPAFVNVSEGTIGVHMTKEEQREFNFGTVIPDTAIIKTLNLTSENSPPAQVHIEIEGGISPWIELERNDFLLNGPAQVNVTLTIPEGTEQGRYSGSAIIHYTTSYGASLIHILLRR